MMSSLADFMKINMEGLFNRQMKIFNRYDSIKKSFDMKDSFEFIKNLDRYILHAIEEVYEFYDTSNSSNSELVDIFNYLVTINAILFSITNVIPKTLYVPMKTYSSEFDVNIILHEINSKLIKVRRLFPERKWHKNETETITTIKLESCQTLTIEAMYGVYLIASCSPFLNIDYNALASLSEAKMQKIMKIE